MFSNLNSGSDYIIYDFESEENAPKWKKLFTGSLQKSIQIVANFEMAEAPTNNPAPDKAQDFGGFTAEKGPRSSEEDLDPPTLSASPPPKEKKRGNKKHKKSQVLSQLHPSLLARDDALEYVESLILRLLAMLCASPPPHTIQEVEERVLRTFPNPIDRWAIGDAQAAIEKGRKKINLMLPVERVHSLLRDALQIKMDYQVTLYIVAVLEYISADILKLAGSYVKNIKDYEVSQQDIRVAMCADKVLMDMFHQGDGGDDPLLGPLAEEPSTFANGSLSYDDLVKDLILEEKAYIRELHMIRKVFRDKLYQITVIVDSLEKKNALDSVFSNINEIYEFSVNLLGSLEDTMEVTKEDELPAIGTCFEELAEGAEFDVYDKYGADVLKPECVETLLVIVSEPEVSNALTTAGHGFKEAVKYYLPRLMLIPVNHVFSYFKYMELLLNSADHEETKESLEQVKGLLWPLQSQLDRAIQASPYNAYLKRKLGEINSKHGRMTRQMNLQKLSEIQKSIEGWEGKDIAQCCTEFLLEGDLRFGPIGRKQSDRHVFLFDGLIVLCKCKMSEYKFKEKFLMRMVEIVDREESDELRHSFEIRPREQPPVVLSAKCSEEKNNWMAALVRLNTQSMLERTLDNLLLEEEKEHPLRLPDPCVYPFAIEDSEENIIVEERENSSGTPVIRGAALFKLVERLTYHMYADPMFVRTFLTTYRSFCSPMELLDLLIQRFEIPEPKPPDLNEDDPPDLKMQKASIHRESLKRFRKEYSQPVQFRVLNVLRHWVDYHFYDFESDQALLDKLQTFLECVKGKSIKKWVDSITKIIFRKCNEEPREITFSHNRSPPSPKVHLHMEDRDWELACVALEPGEGVIPNKPDLVRPLLMLHPIEIARQLTLLDFDLYRAVKPSELVGKHWTKEDKEKRSPNLLKMIHHTNRINNWLQKCVVDCDNFEERVAVLNRIIEVLVMLYDLNNFSGVFQVSGALESAAVHRLELTKAEVRRRLAPYQLKIYDEALELGKNHYKKYLEKLRSINPPCVPFFGMYLTNILHIEEGNADFLPKANGLVNFNKRRKVADITGEIQQYQNQPYCLEVDTKIRHFLENLQPAAGLSEHETSNYLYNRSREIEPKNCKKPPFKERRWPNIPLKSPGIKPRSSRSVPNPLPSMFGSGHKTGDGGPDGEETPHHLTPPTPSTPGTPPASANPADNSIFATVEIGQGALAFGRHEYRGSISSSSYSHGNTSVPPTPIATNPPLPPPPYTPSSLSAGIPPPLPPRRKREPSLGDTSPKVKQAPDAPELPPRDASPPPIPPRAATTTLPRMHSSSALSNTHHPCPPPPYPIHQHSSGSLASIPSSVFSGVSSSLHHLHLHQHHTTPFHHHNVPFCGAPPHLQYRLDPPPQRRRTSSMDLTSPGSATHRSSTNGPHSGISSSSMEPSLSDSPPPPPPRLSTRIPAAFTYDHHNL